MAKGLEEEVLSRSVGSISVVFVVGFRRVWSFAPRKVISGQQLLRTRPLLLTIQPLYKGTAAESRIAFTKTRVS